MEGACHQTDERQVSGRARLGYSRRHSRQAAVYGRRSGGGSLRELASRVSAVCARAHGDHVRRPSLDHSPVRGFLHRQGIQRLLPPQPGRRPERSLGGIRSSHPPRLRFGSSPGPGRRGQGRGGHRFGRGHEDSLRSDSAGTNERFDDHERGGAAGHGRLHRGRRRAGRRSGKAHRHDSERHFKRIPDPQHVYLSAAALHADRFGHHRLLLREHAQVQHGEHQRLSHDGGRGRFGAAVCLYPGRWAGVRARGARRRFEHRRFCPAAVVFLRRRHELLHGDRHAPGCALSLARTHQPFRAQKSPLHHAAHARPDLRLESDRTGSLQQHHPHHPGGPVGRSGRHPVAAHQFLRRSHRAADRFFGPDRAQHPVDHSGRVADLSRGRPPGRQLLRRGADKRNRHGGPQDHRRGRRDGGHGQSDQPRRSPPAVRPGSIRSRTSLWG